jgi:DNA repair protein RadC
MKHALYKIQPERLYAGFDEVAKNPAMELPPQWKFLQVETVLKRDAGWDPKKVPSFTKPEMIAEWISELLKHLETSDRERIYAIFLDQRNRPLGVHEVHVGTMTESVAHPRELFRAAIKANATGIVFVHNHPSGQMEFSGADLKLLDRLEEVSKLLGFRMLDFMVIGHGGEVLSASVTGRLRVRE